VDGVIVEVNELLADNPELINEDPYGDGWIMRIKASAKLDGLLDAAAYEAIAIEEDEDDDGSLTNAKLAG
jgi:glycine cleavage system H protein